jgi:hypothetical protein
MKSNNGFCPNQGFTAGWQTQFPVLQPPTNPVIRILLRISLAEPKVKSKKMSPTDPVEEEEKVEAEVEAELRPEKEEENLGKASPKDISDTHLLPWSDAIPDDLPDKMGELGVPTISYLIGSQKFNQALWDHGASVSIIPKVIYDQLNHDSLVPTSLHLQLADQSIQGPVGIAKDIPVRIRNSFMHVDFVVLKMDVCRQIPLILGRPFLSTTGATIDVAARIIKLNISRKEGTSTFKPKGTKKCNQVMVMIRLERNATTPDKTPSTAENFSTQFSWHVKNATSVVTRSLVVLVN